MTSKQKTEVLIQTLDTLEVDDLKKFKQAVDDELDKRDNIQRDLTDKFNSTEKLG